MNRQPRDISIQSLAAIVDQAWKPLVSDEAFGLASGLLDELTRVLARYDGYRLVNEGPIPAEPRRFEAWTSTLYERLAFLAGPSSNESDLQDVTTSVEQHARFGDFLNLDRTILDAIGSLTDAIRSGGVPASLRDAPVRQRIAELLTRIESRIEPYRSVRSSMDVFLRDPSRHNAQALASGLAPLIEETDLGRYLDDLRGDLARYAPGGGE